MAEVNLNNFCIILTRKEFLMYQLNETFYSKVHYITWQCNIAVSRPISISLGNIK